MFADLSDQPWLTSSRTSSAGTVAFAEGRFEDAIALLHLGEEGVCIICALPLLGRAYDLAGEPDSALAVYERYVTKPEAGRTLLDEIGFPNDVFWLPMTFERLGALYKERGEPEKAINYYGRFVGLWRDADPELQPRVEAARRVIRALSRDRVGTPP